MEVLAHNSEGLAKLIQLNENISFGGKEGLVWEDKNCCFINKMEEFDELSEIEALNTP